MKLLAGLFSSLGSGISQGAVLVLVTVAIFGGGYIKGAAGVRTEWEAETARRTARAAEVKAGQAEVVVRTVTQYVDRVRTIRQQGETIIQEVPVYVPSDACPLPGGFRLLHDAAARGEPADAAGLPDAAPVEPQAAARTVADNYTACRENAQQLTALQAWVEGVTEAGK